MDVLLRIFVFSILLQACQGSSFIVNPPDRIQAAIDQASNGDIIIINKGIYYENLVVNKSLILKGNGSPVIDGSGNGSVIVILANETTLDGLVAENSSFESDGIKLISIYNNSIKNNTIHKCGSGLNLLDSSSNIIMGNNISDNRVAINISNGSRNLAQGNEIYNNEIGIKLWISNNNSLSKNNINFIDQQGIIIRKSNGNHLADNIVSFCSKDGVSIMESNDNIMNDSKSHNNTMNGISLIKSNSNLLSNNRVFYNDQSSLSLDDSDNNIIANNNASYSVKSPCINIIRKSDNNSFKNNSISHNYQYGISMVQSTNNSIEGNEISNNNNGIKLIRSNSNFLINNNFTDNYSGYGIQIIESNNCTINRNNAVNNQIGLLLRLTENCLIIEDHFSNNTAKGIILESSQKNLIENNSIYNHTFGIFLQNSPKIEIYKNNISKNKIGIYLNRSNESMFVKNNIINNDVGIATNLSYNYSIDYIIHNSKHNMIVNENESISEYPLWRSVVSEHLEWKGAIDQGLATETGLVGISKARKKHPVIMVSHPSGAEIWLDGTNTTKHTPYKLNIKKRGSHKFELILIGYESKIVELRIPSPEPIEVYLTPILPSNANLYQNASDSGPIELNATANSVPKDKLNLTSAKKTPAFEFLDLISLIIVLSAGSSIKRNKNRMKQNCKSHL